MAEPAVRNHLIKEDNIDLSTFRMLNPNLKGLSLVNCSCFDWTIVIDRVAAYSCIE